jgi:hypothetical protein
MMALMFGNEMVDALLREVSRMADDNMPRTERRKRIATLTDEAEQLAYVEEALVAAAIANDEDVQRSLDVPPQAVLGVKVAEATKSSRAA